MWLQLSFYPERKHVLKSYFQIDAIWEFEHNYNNI